MVDLQADDLLLALRQASGEPGLSLQAGPRPLNADGTVQVVRLGSTGALPAAPAVVRLCDRYDNATREAVIANYLNRVGFPTPPVLLTGSVGDALGGAWLLIKLVPGPGVRLGSSRRPREVFRLIRSVRARPALLADLTARLHTVDPEPARQDLVRTDSGFDWREFLWDRATSVSGPGAAEIIEWLELNEPTPSPLVLSHGDLHIENVVISADGPQIIDWGIGCLAPPARDVACTMFALLTTGSRLAPGPTGPAFAALGRRLSGQFLRRYQARAPFGLSTDELNWHRVLYSMNRLFWAALDDDTLTTANLGEALAPRAGRSDETLKREFPIHARIISDITGVRLPRAPSTAGWKGFDR